MKNKNIPALITLCAGTIASITCIVNNYPLLDTLWIVLLILFVFYVIGLIVGKVINKINKAANDSYVKAEQERMKAEKLELEELQSQETQGLKANDSVTRTNDI